MTMSDGEVVKGSWRPEVRSGSMLPRQAAGPEVSQAPVTELTRKLQQLTGVCECRRTGACAKSCRSWGAARTRVFPGPMSPRRWAGAARARAAVCAGACVPSQEVPSWPGSANCRLASLHQGANAELRCTPWAQVQPAVPRREEGSLQPGGGLGDHQGMCDTLLKFAKCVEFAK